MEGCFWHTGLESPEETGSGPDWLRRQALASGDLGFPPGGAMEGFHGQVPGPLQVS